MQRVLVDEQRWISLRRFLFALSYCTLLPAGGAAAATYVGWLLNGGPRRLGGGHAVRPARGGRLLALSSVYVAYGARHCRVGLSSASHRR
jgi:chromate transporter